MERMSESGLPIRPVYDETQLTNFRTAEKLGEPGAYPYTRGVYPTMSTKRPWTMRQYAGFASATETNRRFQQLIEAGTTGLSVAFDLPTQMGYDSDATIAHGEVGKVGVAIDSIDDMRRLFDGIPLGEVSTSMTINAPAAVLLELLSVDPAIETEQAARLERLRSRRDAAEFTRRISHLKATAEGTGNLLYQLREALRAEATLGEVFDALRDVRGIYRPPDAY
jgi:methylmalonyl-CoA mutase, N-terminal domain